MARNVSDEELQLKKRARRRLVGAIVLVTAVAVLLPMILDSEPRPTTQEINIQIPSPDAGVLSAKPMQLKPAAPMPAPVEKSEAPQSTVMAETKSEPQPEAKPAAKPAPKPTAAKSVAKPPAKTPAVTAVKEPPKAEADGAFVIQVVALSDTAKAKELQAKIAGGGMKAYTEVVQTEHGPVTRVRIGPYASREAAEKGRQQLQGMALDGKVVPK